MVFIRDNVCRPALAAYLVTMAVICLAPVGAQPDDDGALLNEPPRLSAVYSPNKSLEAHVWTNYSSSSFVFPELSSTPYGMPALKAKPNWGLALSGGSFRALSLSIGVTRALWQMGYLQQMRYISSASGGSIFNGPFSYQNSTPIDTFLGPSLAPANVTLAAIQNPPAGSFELAASKVRIDRLYATPTAGRSFNDSVGPGAQFISDYFLAPFGLGSAESTVSIAGTSGGIDAEYSRKSPVPVFVAGTQDRPFPIIQATIRVPNDLAGLFNYPFEFSPLYFGSPGQTLDTQPVAIGGGYVEPSGFNSPPPAQGVVSPDGSKTVKVKPAYIVPLMGAVASSSGAAAKVLPDSIPIPELTRLGLADFNYFNSIDFQGAQLRFVDGGASDGTAIIGLLRRGVSTIVACVAVTTPPNGNATEWAAGEPDTAGLFGVLPESAGPLYDNTAAQWNKKQQVFPTASFQAVFNSYQALVTAGAAPIVQVTLPVLSNAFQGVKGGYNATLILYMNAQITQWEDQLPADTLSYLNVARSATGTGVEAFPYTNTKSATFYPQPELIVLLSQQASYSIMQANATLAAALADVKTATAAAGAGSGMAGRKLLRQ